MHSPRDGVRPPERRTTRLDLELVRRRLARSRGQARELIDGGRVHVRGVVASRPALQVSPDDEIEVARDGPAWVSRAAYKLVAALAAFGPLGLTVAGKRCVDVGASTGGFTQVLLHHGAREVLAVDVGRDQLAPELRDDARVTEHSGTTIRGLDPADLGGPAELVVADLSFISLTLVLQDLAGIVSADGDLVVLVKPQFEVGRARLGKNGIVRRSRDRAIAVTDVARVAVEVGLHPMGLERSPVEGTTGNVEFLLWMTRRMADTMSWEALVSTVDRVTEED